MRSVSTQQLPSTRSADAPVSDASSPPPAQAVGCRVVASRVLLCCLSLCIGSALIILNKDLMRVKHFKYPMTLSGLGLTFCAVVSTLAVRSGAVELQKECKEMVNSYRWYTTCLPVGLCKAGSLSLGNWSYLYLNMGFIQMLNCFAPVVIMLVMFLLRVGVLRPGVMHAVFAICVGTAMTTSFDPSVNFTGCALMVGSMFCEGFAIVLTQRLLQNKQFTVLEAQYALAPAGAAALMTTASIFEWRNMLTRGGVQVIQQHPVMFVLAGTLGLASNLVSFQVIQTLSSLSMKIVNMLRGVGLVGAGIIFYHERVTKGELAGFALSICGLVAYNYASMQPMPVDAAAAGSGGDAGGGGGAAAERRGGAERCGHGPQPNPLSPPLAAPAPPPLPPLRMNGTGDAEHVVADSWSPSDCAAESKKPLYLYKPKI